MYSNIMVCVDGTYDSEVAAKYAMGMAYQAKTLLTILHVQNPKDIYASESIDRLKRIAQRRDVAIRVEVRQGEPLEQIKDAVKKLNIDVVIASSGGKVKQEGIFSQNLSYDLIRELDETVFIIKSVRGTTAKEHAKILCPIQSVTPSLSERSYALGLISKLYSCPISLLRCLKIEPDKILTKNEVLKVHESMRSYLMPLTTQLTENDIKVYTYTRTCYSIKEAVLDFLERNKFDLLFLRVTPGRFFRFVKKDFSIEVMKNSECNVILWKPKGQ